MAASSRLRTYCWVASSGSISLVVSEGSDAGGHGGVAGGVGGRQVDRVAAAGELGGDEVGDGGLADPTLAGDEDHAASGPLELVDEPSQAPTCWRGAGAGVAVGSIGRAGPHDEGPECPDADEVPGDQRYDGDGESVQRRGLCAQGVLLGRGVGLGDDIPRERLGQDAVDHQLLLVDPELVELSSGVGGDGEGALVGSRHEHHGRQGWILEGGNGGGIDGAVVLEAGQRARQLVASGLAPR